LAVSPSFATFGALLARGRRQRWSGTVAQLRGAGVFDISLSIIGRSALVIVVLVGVGSALAGDDFPLTGSYTQNVPCKGDGSDPKSAQVKISPQEIVSNMGICTILNTTQEGNTFNEHVECKFASGPIMGDISFTPRPDKTLDFVDRDGNYKAILHRCPD
jgi:hypothetical protein